MSAQHIDVLIVGAGVSGVGAACHLQKHCPGTSFAILEGREAFGGTWDLFRYPGIRSDSDMSTLGYSFRPWHKSRSIAGGAEIRSYVADTAVEHGVDRHVRFGHHVTEAEWSSEEARWTVRARREDDGREVEFTCSFLFVCSGYYDYRSGYTPEFPGVEQFGGRLVHPQLWPEDLDYSGKRVVVIGSGATAVTLVPAMAEQASHVTMLQRSPTYMASRPAVDPLAVKLRERLPAAVADTVVRWKSIATAFCNYQRARRFPRKTKALLRRGVVAQLPEGYDVDTHFAPRYNPWDQRLCLVPDGDIFGAISEGRASVVTDHIKTFTDRGVELRSGAVLEADVVVTATGLNMLPAGGIGLTVDGDPVDLPETVAYKGMMLSGVPNFAFALGYINSSWTLRAELVARYVCDLINDMQRRRLRTCVPRRPEKPGRAPLFDLDSGYAQRGNAVMPKQGAEAPWRMHHNYLRERLVTLRRTGRRDTGLHFS